jgi:signal transduction histidine kinase
MAKLFGLFSKIRDKRVENPLGVGLGLAISKQLVELMRGQIHVTSVYGRA